MRDNVEVEIKCCGPKPVDVELIKHDPRTTKIDTIVGLGRLQPGHAKRWNVYRDHALAVTIGEGSEE